MIERDKEYYNQKISELYSVIENQEKIIRDVQGRNAKAIENIEGSIKSINDKLGDKEIRVENGRIVNPINDYRVVRLKGIRTKCKEILKILKGAK